MVMQHVLVILFSFFLMGSVFAEEIEVPLQRAPIDLQDLASLQRGAVLFMNRCSSCHSLQYLRYDRMGRDIGLVDSDGELMGDAIKQNLMFVGDKLSDTIQTAMTKDQGVAWFGVAPPDLSLTARSRGVNWLYTYLKSFYLDEKRPWGVNNTVFPDVAMPDVLYGLRQELLMEENGQQKYDRVVLDLVNFLAYAAEPMQLKRKKVGIWVMLFLGIFCVFAWLLKREYWKDVS